MDEILLSLTHTASAVYVFLRIRHLDPYIRKFVRGSHPHSHHRHFSVSLL